MVSVADVASAASAASEPAPAGPGYAMVLIDMQNDFMNAERPSVIYGTSTPMPEEKRQRILDNTQRLTTAMRAHGWPVIYVHVGRREDNLDDAHSPVDKETRSLPAGVTHCALGTWGAQVVDEISPLDDDFMVRKTGGSGFGFTPLHRILRNLNVRNLLMTGGAVTGCVWADRARRRHARLRRNGRRRRHVPAGLGGPRDARTVVRRPRDRRSPARAGANEDRVNLAGPWPRNI